MPAPSSPVILQSVTFNGPLGETITTYAEFLTAYSAMLGTMPAETKQPIIDFIFGKLS